MQTKHVLYVTLTEEECALWTDWSTYPTIYEDIRKEVRSENLNQARVFSPNGDCVAEIVFIFERGGAP